MPRQLQTICLSCVLVYCAFFATPVSAAPTLALAIAAGSSENALPGGTVLVDISLVQTSAVPGLDLITDGVSNFGFNLDLSHTIGTVTDFIYGPGFQSDIFFPGGLPTVVGQSTSNTAPFVTKSSTNELLLGTAVVTIDGAVPFGSQTALTVSDFSAGANFRFDSGTTNVDDAVFASNPSLQISAIPEPGAGLNMVIVVLLLFCSSRMQSKTHWF